MDTKSKLTIYSESGHLIDKLFSIDSKIEISMILPKSVDPESIVVVNSKGTIIPFEYIPKKNIETFLENVIVTKKSITFNGKIISLDANDVILSIENDNVIKIKDYDTIETESGDNFIYPHLIVNTDSSQITISYLFSDISWSCIGTALIDDTDNTMYLRLSGYIDNNEFDITADVSLVTGEVNQNDNHLRKMVPMAMMKSSTTSKKQTSLEDYVKYDIGNRTIHNKSIVEIGVKNLDITKMYVHVTDSDLVDFGYRFIASEFIPKCKMKVYSIDSNADIDSFLGSTTIKESQKGDTVDIIIGRSTILQCKDKAVTVLDHEMTDDEIKTHSLDNQKWHMITENIEVEIINHSDKPATLILKHFIGEKKILEVSCEKYNRKREFIEWILQISPMTNNEPYREMFNCKIVTITY